MDLMTQIANDKDCKTDKVGRYLNFYNSIFQSKRTKYKKVCEIGVYKGQSIKLWLEYFPEAQVYAIDCVEKFYKQLPKHDRVTGFFGDSRVKTGAGENNALGMAEFETKCGKDFDFILDDGTHKTCAIQQSLASLFPLVKSGGWYIIEDIAACMRKDGCASKVDGSDRINTALDVLKETGKMGKTAIHMSHEEIEYVENNTDRVVWHPNKTACAIRKK